MVANAPVCHQTRYRILSPSRSQFDKNLVQGEREYASSLLRLVPAKSGEFPPRERRQQMRQSATQIEIATAGTSSTQRTVSLVRRMTRRFLLSFSNCYCRQELFKSCARADLFRIHIASTGFTLLVVVRMFLFSFLSQVFFFFFILAF